MSLTTVFRDQPFPEIDGKRKVLVTGAAGGVGSAFAEYAKDRYELRLLDKADGRRLEAIEAFGEVVVCDLTDLEGLKKACEGIDTVVHLGADPRTFATWESLLPNNIVGTYNMFEAARSQGCRRVIFASTMQTVSWHPWTLQVRPDDPVNPGNLYGATKCWGEALCRVHANNGMSSIAIRIAAFQTLESIKSEHCDAPLWAFVSHRDLAQLISCCVDDLTLQFGIFYGLSNNEFNKGDLSESRRILGYKPLDDVFADFNIPYGATPRPQPQ